MINAKTAKMIAMIITTVEVIDINDILRIFVGIKVVNNVTK